MRKELKKPVHPVLLKPSPVQTMQDAGKFPERALQTSTPAKQDLPKEEVATKILRSPIAAYSTLTAKGAKVREQTLLRTKLKVIHSNCESPTGALKPDCKNCKTSACCYAFMVNISEMEYESGIYGDNAVKITPEIAKGLGTGRFIRLATMNSPSVHNIKDGSPQYFLEGPIGVPCKYLEKDGRCGVYEVRPITCRVYTCVIDDRITQEMRDGDVNIGEAVLEKMLNAGKH